MKKLFSLLLSLSLLCAGVAVAENVIDVENPSQSTTVTFEVPEPETSYTVTIPASVSFIEDATTASMSVTIGGDSTLAIGATLKVILENSSNSFQLKQGDNAIAYAIKKDGSPLSTGSEVLTWTEGEAVPGAATLNLEVTGTIDGLPSGAYTDTLTFKATVSTGGVGAGHDGFEELPPFEWKPTRNE